MCAYRFVTLIGMMLLAAAATFVLPLQAENVFGCDEHTMQHARPGDEGYGHCQNHDVYKTLRKEYGIEDEDQHHNSCCHTRECGVTVPLRPAPPQNTVYGADFEVWIDGKWCPISKRILVNLRPDLRSKVPDNTHLQNFVRLTHVCASRHYHMYKSGRDSCPLIHCVFDGGFKS